MILHTIVDYNDIFNSTTENFSAICYKPVNGGVVELRKNPDGTSKISRLYSTNPHLFLDKKYCQF